MALLEFYGDECHFCKQMEPVIDQLKKEGFKIEQYEVWHDEENAKKMLEYDDGACGAVPFFVNTKTGKMICGASDYDGLKAWAEGK